MLTGGYIRFRLCLKVQKHTPALREGLRPVCLKHKGITLTAGALCEMLFTEWINRRNIYGRLSSCEGDESHSDSQLM